jgi:hypothetical protein
MVDMVGRPGGLILGHSSDIVLFGVGLINVAYVDRRGIVTCLDSAL